MIFDFIVGESHWSDHMRPVWAALGEDRGAFVVRFSRTACQGDAIVTASISDFNKAVRLQRVPKPVILFEHGAGFSFNGDGLKNGSYAGGYGRQKAALFPSTNHWVADQNRASYPNIEAPIVGCPKMDRLIQTPDAKRGIIGVAFHWDCTLTPETRSAFEHYQPILKTLAKQYKGRIIGHCHPRAWHHLFRLFRAYGIPATRRFEEVLDKASVYVNDASSTLYEFAALDRPVVVLNAPWYRRNINHGLRFWEHADVGIQVNEPGELIDSIEAAFNDPLPQKQRRREAVAQVYPFLGHSTEKAVNVLREWASKQSG